MMMSTLTLGVNGFGRIGRLICRVAEATQQQRIVAINDPFLTVDAMVRPHVCVTFTAVHDLRRTGQKRL